MTLKIFLVVLGFIAFGMVCLCIKLFFGQKFVHLHIDGNKPLNKKGIHCVQSLDAHERKANPHRISERGDEEHLTNEEK